jgi:stress response protein YsnF
MLLVTSDSNENINSYTNKNGVEHDNKNKENPIIILPKKVKDSRMKIKQSTIHHERFFSHKVSHLLESVKEKTTDYVDKVKLKQQNIHSFATTNIQQKGNDIKKNEQLQPQFVIPVIEEKYTLSKKPILEDVKIEKRWITHNEKIHIPVSYEKLFVNDKELDSYSTENIFTHLKDKFLDFVYIEGDDDEESKIENEKRKNLNQNKEYQKQIENEKEIQQIKNENSALFDEEEKANHSIHKEYYNNNGILSDEYQKVIPLFAEKIIISKRKVKVGEIIINKRKVIEDRKINFEIIREKITVNYADGRKENIIE